MNRPVAGLGFVTLRCHYCNLPRLPISSHSSSMFSMPRRVRINGPLLTGLFACATGIGLYVCWPLLIERITGHVPNTAVPRTAVEIIRERSITAVTGLWFFVFGATIGSFLNVVASRMPLGMTIVSKPSRCPYCETPIKFKHNVPIFGWLALRGRCSACRLPISIRYPLVEVMVGLLFFLLFWREVVSAGANLPVELQNARRGIMWNVLSPNWHLISLYFFHAFLIGVLSTIALIKFDRLRIPAKLVWFTVILAIALRAIWPNLNVSPWWSPSAAPIMMAEPWGRIFDPIMGTIVGWLVGWTAHEIVETRRWHDSNSSRSGILVITTIVGAFLGWQMVVPFLLTTTLIQFVTMLIGHLLGRPVQNLWATSSLWAVVLVICLWKQLALLGLPHAASSIGTHWAWLVVALISVYATRRFSPAPTL